MRCLLLYWSAVLALLGLAAAAPPPDWLAGQSALCRAAIAAAEAKYQLPANLLDSIAKVESGRPIASLGRVHLGPGRSMPMARGCSSTAERRRSPGRSCHPSGRHPGGDGRRPGPDCQRPPPTPSPTRQGNEPLPGGARTRTAVGVTRARLRPVAEDLPGARLTGGTGGCGEATGRPSGAADAGSPKQTAENGVSSASAGLSGCGWLMRRSCHWVISPTRILPQSGSAKR
jgi:hypothetical protein